MIVYFSSVSGFTDKFIQKLGLPALRIPLNSKEAESFVVDEDFVLITPTYGAMKKGFVPKQVVRFLLNPANDGKLKGVIGSGNRNFYEDYARAADSVSAKFNVPVLYRFELAGTAQDVDTVKEGMKVFWELQKTQSKATSTSTQS
mgnify:CR=1 FL=1